MGVYSHGLAWSALLGASVAALACNGRSSEAPATGGAAGMAGSAGVSGLSGAGGNVVTAGGAAGGGGTPSGSGGTVADLAGMAGTAGMGGNVATAGAAGMPGAAGGTVANGGAYDVLVDPYGTNPLAAVVNLRGIDAGDVKSVEVVVPGQDGAADFTKTYAPADTELIDNLDSSDLDFPAAGYHVPVYGLYADRENAVRLHVERLAHDPLDVTLPLTTPLAKPGEDAWVPGITVHTSVPEQMEPGWTVAELNIEPLPSPPIVFVEWTRYIAFDERGAIRWALRFDELPKGETFTLRRSIDGNFLTGSLDTLIEVNTLGRILQSSKVADHTLNHDLLQIGSKDNCEGSTDGSASKYAGNLLALASKNGASTVQDHVLELDARTATVLNDWDLGQVLDPTRTTFVDPAVWSPGVDDWLHDNGLAYSAADEAIVVSGRHQGVAKIRRDESLVWLLAPHKGWNEPQLDKLLTAVNAAGTPYDDSVQLGDAAAGDANAPEFDWPFGQHSPTLLPDGDLLLFDNGNSRHFGPTNASYSRAVVYRIDEAAMTVRQLGQYALTKRESSFYVSNTYQLPMTGNLFIQPGGSASNPAVVKELATEVADDGTVSFGALVFDAAIDLSFADPSNWYVYSYRGHRWTF